MIRLNRDIRDWRILISYVSLTTYLAINVPSIL
jgi:hypothetical protein